MSKEKKSAIIIYEKQESGNLVEAFCKEKEELHNHILSLFESGGENRVSSLSDLLVHGLESGIIDGSDLMIFAVIGLRTCIDDTGLNNLQHGP